MKHFTAFALALVTLLTLSASAQPRIPDVYVASNNSFVISVPNLTRVAVGNPKHVTANVISPTEVLIQGGAGTAGNGTWDIGESDLYVWSGDKRYVYRVVVVEDDDTALADFGVSRVVVEPDKIILFGMTPQAFATSLELKSLRAAGLKIENRIETVDLTKAAEEQQAQRKAQAYAASRPDSSLIATAIANHQVLKNMTREEVIRSRGVPPVAPTLRFVTNSAGATEKQEELVYPDVTVLLRDDLVDRTFSHVSVEQASARELERVTLPSATGATTAKRVYRLKYIDTAEALSIVRQFVSTGGKFVSQDAMRMLIVEDQAANMETIDQIMRMLDTPRYDNGISVMRTKYVEGMTSIGGTTPEIVVVKLGTMIDGMTRTKFVRDLQDMADRIRADYVADAGDNFDFKLIPIANAVVLIGPPGILDILSARLAQNYVKLSNDDIQRTVENGGLIQGMTRDQVAAALRRQPEAGPIQVQTSEGVLWEYRYPGMVLRFKNDQLYAILDLPTAEQIKAAQENRMLLWGLTREQVDKILGERGTPLTVAERRSGSLSEALSRYQYKAGEALFRGARLEEFLPVSGSNVIVPGSLLPGSGGLGNVYAKLSDSERARLIENQIVVPGMTLADVTAIFGGAAPSYVKTEIDDAGRVVWAYHYAGQTIYAVNGMVVNVDHEGQDEMVSRVIHLISRKVEEVAPLASAYAPDTASINVGMDTVSNNIIIRGRLGVISAVEKFIGTLDRQDVRQVLIEAKFVEIKRTAALKLGIEWGLSTQSASGNQPGVAFNGDASPPNPRLNSGGSNLMSSITDAGTMLLGMMGGKGFSFHNLKYTNVDVLIQAMEQNGVATTLSSPRILAQNNTRAKIENTTEEFDLTYTPNQIQVGSTYTTVYNPNPERVSAGITLLVTPTIQENGMINLYLDATISEFLAAKTFPSGSDAIPATIMNPKAQRVAQSWVTIRAGEPLVIGGLTRKKASESVYKVPFFGDVPVFGYLFRSKTVTDEDVDLLIFLTAREVMADGSISEAERLAIAPRPHIPNPQPTVTLPAAPAAR